MRRATTVAGLCLFLGACANLYSYSKPGADSPATQTDIEACMAIMAPYTGDVAKEAFDKCMADKGYEKKIEKYRLM